MFATAYIASNMQPSRIAELLQPFLPPSGRRLTEKDLSDISMYIDILQRWNSRINLTAIRDEEEIVTRHFGESFFAAAHLFPAGGNEAQAKGAAPTVADVGSGPGFPGLPSKLWAHHIALTLIESNHKKSTFLREVTRALKLTDIDIQNTRAEEMRTKFDLVALRAVDQFKNILPVAASLVAPSGRLALLVSSSQVEDAISVVGLNWQQPLAIPESKSRVLLVGNR